MNRRFGYYAGSAGAVLAALCMVGTPAFAQQGKASDRIISGYGGVHKLPPGGPAPRATDGHPDLSGVWFPNNAGVGIMAADPVDPDVRTQFDPKVTPEEKPSFQPWAAAKIKAQSRVDAALGDPGVSCSPEGIPGMSLQGHPYPIQLVQTPGQLVQLAEFRNNFRVIPTDGRPHDPNADPTFNGDPVGHWERDTLVIDVIAIDEKGRTRGFAGAFFHSDQEHVIERFSRPSMNYLLYQVTIDDPKVLTKPWTSAPRRRSLGHERLQEFYCTNEQDAKEFQSVKEKEEKESKGNRN